jgi:thioredoxin 1
MNILGLKEFGLEVPQKGKLIIQVNSKWCSSCKRLTSILHKFKQEGITEFIQIDVDHFPQINKIFRITAVPTLIFFKDGEMINYDIHINEFPFVKKGMMVGLNCESILKEILAQI